MLPDAIIKTVTIICTILVCSFFITVVLSRLKYGLKLTVCLLLGWF